MKKILSLILTLSLCLSLSACLKINMTDQEGESISTDKKSESISIEDSNDISSISSGSYETVTDTIYNISYEVPREWLRTEADDGYDYDLDDLSVLQVFILFDTDFYVDIETLMSSKELQSEYMEEIVSELNGEVSQDIYSIDIKGHRGFGFKMIVEIFGEQYMYDSVIVENGIEAYCFFLGRAESQSDKYTAEYEAALNS